MVRADGGVAAAGALGPAAAEADGAWREHERERVERLNDALGEQLAPDRSERASADSGDPLLL